MDSSEAALDQVTLKSDMNWQEPSTAEIKFKPSWSE